MVETIDNREARDYDLAIIGAGIIGVCAAWYARSQHPQWRIVLIDQGKVGGGATHYSASLDLPYGHTPLRYQLAERSQELYLQLRKELPDLPIKDLIFYGIVSAQNAPSVLQQITDSNATLSPDIIPALLNDYPQLVLPAGTSIISDAAASQAVTNDVADLLAENFAATPGSSVIEHTKVIKVKSADNKFELQTSGGGCYGSARVIQATGPWKNEIAGPAFLTGQNTRVKKIVAFHIHHQPKPTDPLFYFFDDDAFLMPKYEAGYWLFSFKCDHWDVLPAIETLHIDNTDIEKAQGILQKYYPSFAPLCTQGRVFCDLYAGDGDPVIDQAINNSNYVFAGAGAGSGYRLAPAIAEEAVNSFL